MIEKCYNAYHITYFFSLYIPLLIILLLIPSKFFFNSIQRQKINLIKKFYHFNLTIKYGILFYEYKGRAYYFEMIKLFHKIFMLIIINLLISFNTIELLILLLIMILYDQI